MRLTGHTAVKTFYGICLGVLACTIIAFIANIWSSGQFETTFFNLSKTLIVLVIVGPCLFLLDHFMARLLDFVGD